jgi:hypothetical protein
MSNKILTRPESSTKPEKTLVRLDLVTRVLYNRNPYEGALPLTEQHISPSDYFTGPVVRGFGNLMEEGIFLDGRGGKATRVYHIHGSTVILRTTVCCIDRNSPDQFEIYPTQATVYNNNAQQIELAIEVLNENGFQEYEKPSGKK